MKSNFQRAGADGTPTNRSFVDPEAYDASEQQFAASLEERVPLDVTGEETSVENIATASAGTQRSEPQTDGTPESAPKDAPTSAADQPQHPNPDAWREEVSARLDSYRARRRPRAPRYPSLQLKFEPAEPTWSSPPVPAGKIQPVITERPSAALEKTTSPAELSANPTSDTRVPEPTARVLPFRRVSPAPPKPLEELAEPMQLFPRILEVPEVTPPPPALGGILIEPEVKESSPKRPGIEIPLQTASIFRRTVAAACDGVLVAAAFSLFVYIFFEITRTAPPVKPSIAMGIVVLGIFAAGYQFLLLTYAGNTPGLRIASLRLSQFDGTVVSRRVRCWRVLASVLSGVSLGLGYAWCMLDEDQLCWHDRITRTHLAPR